MGSFKRSYTPQQLRVIAAEVLRQADPTESRHVSQADYDAARAPAGFPDTPQAKYIAVRLGHTWKRVVVLVREDSQSAQRELDAHSGRRAPSEFITNAAARNALQMVCARLGVDTVGVDAYDAERREILKGARDDDEHYLLEEAVPSSARLNHRFGSWKKVCEAADIEVAEPVQARRNSMKKVYSVADCERAMHAALDWAEQEGHDNLTLVLYRQFARTHPDTPHQATVNAVLKRENAGTWSELRSRVQLERARGAAV